jgi:type I restriction enzyme S subunit
MELKPGYKQTEVGVIPADWEAHRLEAFTTVVASGKSKHSRALGTYPVHGSTGIIGYTESPEYEGDAILVARVGANAGKLNVVSGRYGVTDSTF